MPSAGGLLVVYQSRSGSTRRLTEAAVEAALSAVDTMDVVVRHAPDAGPDDVLAATGLLLATPANFGYMSGLLKDFFERIYHPCLERTPGRPYGLVVKGDTDADGAVDSVTRIVSGLRWRRVLPPVVVVGELTGDDLERAAELGATLAAGLEAGVF